MPQNIQTENKVYISGINYDLGNLKDISNLEHLKANPDKLESYYKMGFKTYAEHDKSMIEMAYNSVKKTMEELPVAPEEIDIFIYIAEPKGRAETYNSGDVYSLMKYLGIPNAYAIGLNLSDCANILMGVQMAYSMILSGQAKNIMLVCTNKYGTEPLARLMNMDVSVCSDGAVSAFISSTPGGFEIKGLRLAKYDLSTKAGALLDLSIKKIKALRTITKSLLNEANLSTKDFKQVHINNYFELSQIFIESCGFKPSLGYYGNLASHGHVLSGDVLINLKDQETVLEKDDHTLLLSDGPFGSYAALLQKM